MFLYVIDRCRDGILYLHSIEETGIDHLSLLGVKALFADIAALDDRDDRKVEFLGEDIVTAVMCRDSHDSACSITCEHIFRDPDRDPFAGQRVDSVRSGEDSRHSLGLGDPFALSLFLHIGKVLLDLSLLGVRGQYLDKVALGSKYHERHPEHGVHPGSENGNVMFNLPVIALEDDLAPIGLPYPVALHFLEGIRPIYPVKALEKPSCVG